MSRIAEAAKATASAAVGAATGAGVTATVGNMGLAFAGGAIAITAAPVVGAGAILGLAAYGGYRGFIKPK